jgi:hypothetical protein
MTMMNQIKPQLHVRILKFKTSPVFWEDSLEVQQIIDYSCVFFEHSMLLLSEVIVHITPFAVN